MSATPATSSVAPPTLGQHTLDVLRDVLGKSDAEIAALQDRGIV
jgi:crotonobetainyl-CoA:carnitine CoA-transferase CaiB-like acyl-CoA transferase